MANKYGNMQAVTIFEEVAYNTVLADYSTKTATIYCTMNPKPNKDEITIPFKTGLVVDHPCESLGGKEKDEVTLSGTFTKEVEIFFEGFGVKTGTTTTTYKSNYIVYGQAKSWQIIRSEIRSGSNPLIVDLCMGSTLKAFKLDMSSDIVTFEATFDCFYFPEHSIDVAPILNGLTPISAPSCITPYKKGEVDGVSLWDDTFDDFTSLTLDIAVEYMDDEINFGRHTTRQRQIIKAVTGSYSWSAIYSPSDDMDSNEFLFDPREYGGKGFLDFTLMSDRNFTFGVSSIITSLETPDPEKGIFVTNVSGKLTGKGTHNAIQIRATTP